MKRSGPIKRTASLRRVSRVKAVNRKRREKESARAYGSPDRIAWMKQQRCAVAGRGPDACFGPIDIAHIVTGGMGRKADAAQTVPLCRGHHCEQHQYGTMRFQKKYDLDLGSFATLMDRAWLMQQRQPEHIAPIVSRVLESIAAGQQQESA